MKEKLIEDLEKADLRKIALNLGIGNIQKKNMEKLKNSILIYSYSQIISAINKSQIKI